MVTRPASRRSSPPRLPWTSRTYVMRGYSPVLSHWFSASPRIMILLWFVIPVRFFLPLVIGLIKYIGVIRIVRVTVVIILEGQFEMLVLLLLVMELMVWNSLVLPLVKFADCPVASELTSWATRPNNVTQHTSSLAQASSISAKIPSKAKNPCNPSNSNKPHQLSDPLNPYITKINSYHSLGFRGLLTWLCVGAMQKVILLELLRVIRLLRL